MTDTHLDQTTFAEKPARHRLATWLLLGFAVILYLVLGVRHLGRQDIHLDEAHTFHSVTLPPLELVFERLGGGHVPLYFLMLKAWLALPLPKTYAMVVMPSVLLGLAGLLVFYRLALTLGLGTWSLAAAYLWALHPTILYYARLARHYMGVMLLQLLVVLLFTRCRGRASRATLLMLCLVGVAGVLWNHLVVAVWGTVLLVLLAPAARQQYDRRLLPLSCIMITLHIAMMVLCQVVGKKALGWIEEPELYAIFWSMSKVWGGHQMLWRDAWWQWFLPGMVAAAFMWVLWRMQRFLYVDMSWRLVYLLAVVPVTALLVISLYKPIFHQRYASVYLPPLLLCLVQLLKGLPRPRLVAAVLAVLLVAQARKDLDHAELHFTGFRDLVRRAQEIQAKHPGVKGFTHMPLEAVRLMSRQPPKDARFITIIPKPEDVAWVAEQFRNDGILWELNPVWFLDRDKKDLRVPLGKARFLKLKGNYFLRVYSRDNSWQP